MHSKEHRTCTQPLWLNLTPGSLARAPSIQSPSAIWWRNRKWHSIILSLTKAAGGSSAIQCTRLVLSRSLYKAGWSTRGACRGEYKCCDPLRGAAFTPNLSAATINKKNPNSISITDYKPAPLSCMCQPTWRIQFSRVCLPWFSDEKERNKRVVGHGAAGVRFPTTFCYPAPRHVLEIVVYPRVVGQPHNWPPGRTMDPTTSNNWLGKAGAERRRPPTTWVVAEL